MHFRLIALMLSVSSALVGQAVAAEMFVPGDLIVTRSVYMGTAATVTVGQTLPGGGTAIADGTYPNVFNNAKPDPSFGVTSPIFLDQLTTSGTLVNSLNVTAAAAAQGINVTTSFSSKSETAINLSTNVSAVTFMGYVANPGTLDVSNSNTPGVIDPTNPVPSAFYRVTAQMNAMGKFTFTNTSAYSGNNGRAAILNDSGGSNLLYTSGNAGNGGTPQPDGIIVGAGAQIMNPSSQPLRRQQPGSPTPVGSFNITQLGDKPDKVGKDTNFRGLTVFNNVVYFTKGSGGNGVNTVYFIDTTGTACPNGTGLPAPGAALPTSPIAYDPSVLQTEGVTPYNMCILPGFPTALKSTTSFPFGIWFANANTLYVADEGNGDNAFSAQTGTYSVAAGQTTAGLQKWIFNGTSWNLAYTVSAGLALGVPFTVPGYPTGDNAATGLPWAPATDGLRNITGRVNRDGTVTIWAITSTVSGGGDQGADPNKLVTITDPVSATSALSGESFQTVQSARSGQVLRGVSFTPGTGTH